jgi:diguanylate cyclase (GGDEF)-like protein
MKRQTQDAERDERDESARLRDVTAEQRDREADARDAAASSHTAASREARVEAAADRAGAASDRRQAAADRAHATGDLEHAQLDNLTGVYTRGLGGIALQNEIDRSRRSGEPFVLAFVDVDGLKALNDRDGHAAGDALLQHVVGALRSQLRSYDPIVRLGGDEFLCGFTNTDLATSQRRVEEIQAAVACGPDTGSVSVGVAGLATGDTLEVLTSRADDDMYSHKGLLDNVSRR